MPIDDPMWRRRRERAEEKTKTVTDTQIDAGGSTDKLKQLMDLAEPMLEQLNSLYNQYLNGVERNPPIERRKQLDQTMQTIMLMNKPGAALQFKCNNMRSQYISYSERWDRMMRDIDNGKIKRRIKGTL